MDANKLHLLLNHYPMIGTIIGVVVLIAGLWTKSDKVKRFSLWLFIAVGLLALPIYASGEIAGSTMAGGIFGDLIKQHKQNALIAFALIEVTGIAALAGLTFGHRKTEKKSWITIIVLVLAVASTVIVTRTTLMGRQIKWGPAASDISPQNSNTNR